MSQTRKFDAIAFSMVDKTNTPMVFKGIVDREQVYKIVCIWFIKFRKAVNLPQVDIKLNVGNFDGVKYWP